ncbi:MAG: AMP-binding protein, partial [Hydrogenophaga sp.]|nr:AMP-binding protein [Hydrogenophaga sp.]
MAAMKAVMEVLYPALSHWPTGSARLGLGGHTRRPVPPDPRDQVGGCVFGKPSCPPCRLAPCRAGPLLSSWAKPCTLGWRDDLHPRLYPSTFTCIPLLAPDLPLGWGVNRYQSTKPGRTSHKSMTCSKKPMPPHPHNISWLLIHQAQRSPQSIAVITPNKEWTYAELDQRVARYAQQLKDQGINAGDRLACIISDELLLLTAFLAAARLAAPVMLVPRSSTVVQRNQWMAAAGVRYVLSDMEQNETDVGHLPFINAKELSTDQPFNVRVPDQFLEVDPQKSILVIVVGSGTTGKPKLMPITHAQMHSRAQRLCVILGVTSKDRLANMAHMEYVGGVHRLMIAFCVGAGFVLLDKERNEWRHWHAHYGVTHLTATVFHAQQMLKDLRVLSRQEAR